MSANAQKLRTDVPVVTGQNKQVFDAWLEKKAKASVMLTEAKEEEQKIIIPMIQKEGVSERADKPDSARAYIGDLNVLVVSRENWTYTEDVGVKLLCAAKAWFDTTTKKDAAAALKEFKDLLEAAHEMTFKESETKELVTKFAELYDSLIVTKKVLNWDTWKSLLDAGDLPSTLFSAVSHRGDDSLYIKATTMNVRCCSKCDEPISKDDKFCKHCGTKQV